MNVQNFKLESFGRGQPKRLLTTTTSWISKFWTFITYWVGYEGYECSKLQSFVLLYYTALTISKSEFVFEHNDIGGGTVVHWYGTPSPKCYVPSVNRTSQMIMSYSGTVQLPPQNIMSRAWIEEAKRLCPERESNTRPQDLQSCALPTELSGHSE